MPLNFLWGFGSSLEDLAICYPLICNGLVMVGGICTREILNCISIWLLSMLISLQLYSLKIQQVVLLTQKCPVFPKAITTLWIYCFVLMLHAVWLWIGMKMQPYARFLEGQKAFQHNWQGLWGWEWQLFTLQYYVFRIMQARGKLLQKPW